MTLAAALDATLAVYFLAALAAGGAVLARRRRNRRAHSWAQGAAVLLGSLAGIATVFGAVIEAEWLI